MLAEIADKCLDAPTEFIGGALLGLMAIVIGAWRRYLVIIPIGLAALVNRNLWDEFHDPWLGPALLQEVGQRRVVLEYVAFDAPFILLLLLSFFICPWIARQFRIGAGQCHGCSYDLRATVISGLQRCPECGRKIPDDMKVVIAALPSPGAIT